MAPDARYSTCGLDVVGIGNAIVDVVQTDDAFLSDQGLQKGGMALLMKPRPSLYAAGGAGLETSEDLWRTPWWGSPSSEAVPASSAGCVMISSAAFSAVTSVPLVLASTPQLHTGATTARCLIYVTPDAERTMCTFLGASTQLEPDDLDLSMVQQTKVLYLEGYLWDSPAAKRAFIAAAEACRGAGGKVALSLSDGFCVDRHRDSFLDLVNGHVDVLFANEVEIKSLYQTDDINDALERVRGCCDVIAITRGGDGSVVLSGDQRWDIGIVNLGALVDTTGAGDLYAGGFLHAYTQGDNLQRCGELGALCAGQIVTQLGARSQVSLQELAATHLN